MNADIAALLPTLAAAFVEDYNAFSGRMKYDDSDAAKYGITFEPGGKYCRIVHSSYGSRSCAGFIAMVDVKGFKAGDLLKAAGWKAPALNFKRGSIFDIESAKANGNIRWTGLG